VRGRGKETEGKERGRETYRRGRGETQRRKYRGRVRKNRIERQREDGDVSGRGGATEAQKKKTG
jgi:hypothetical protein